MTEDGDGLTRNNDAVIGALTVLPPGCLTVCPVDTEDCHTPSAGRLWAQTNL